jgi:hypothetical protein
LDQLQPWQPSPPLPLTPIEIPKPQIPKPVMPNWVSPGILASSTPPASAHRGLQLEVQMEWARNALKRWVDERWLGGDASLGIGFARPLQNGNSVSAAFGILLGNSGTDVPFRETPASDDVAVYHLPPAGPLSSYLQTFLWYDPDPSLGFHLKYVNTAAGTNFGFAVGFSPSNLPGLGDLPNLTPNNVYSPHAAGELGSFFDLLLSRVPVFRYNEQIDAGYWIGVRLYGHW